MVSREALKVRIEKQVLELICRVCDLPSNHRQWHLLIVVQSFDLISLYFGTDRKGDKLRAFLVRFGNFDGLITPECWFDSNAT